MTTPKPPGTTPGPLGAAFTFSPALLGASPALLGASPAAAHHLLSKHRSPAAGFSTPEALAAMGMGMGMGMGLTPGASGLGIPTIMTLPPDENKKRELGEILRLLALRPGRISEEGVERLAKRMGLECYRDTDSAGGIKTMSLAGKLFVLDIDFRTDHITRVALSFLNTPGPSTDLSNLADAILLRNLSPPPTRGRGGAQALISPSLSDFADNLDRLAKTDRLSAPPHLNCFLAITGIYASLCKIFEYEKVHIDGGELSALCKGTGRPLLHARGKTGLSVDYWYSRRHLPSEGGTGEGEEDSADIWRVLIEVCEAPTDYALNPTATAITPVRTTPHWVSDEVKKPSTDSLFGDLEDTTTDWLEPPLEELPDPSPHPPSSRFIARLDPPVAVPFADEVHLFSTLLLDPPAGINADTLEALLFPPPPAAKRTRRIWGPDGEDVTQSWRLHTGLRPVYARYVHEVPFSHPKELAGVFAVLRQFVMVGTLLRSCFDPRVIVGPEGSEDALEDGDADVDPDADVDVDTFLSTPTTTTTLPPSLPSSVDVDVTLIEQPGVFGLAVVFPCDGAVASFSVEVGRNAEVRVVVEGERETGGETARVLERVLVVTEDLGVGVEYVRRR